MDAGNATIEKLLEHVRDEYRSRMTRGDSALLRQIEDYIAARNGKMLRPRLLLTAAATLGEEHLHSRRTMLLAVAIEMLHNASLLHDDVVDADMQRRGQPSVNARWGNAAAILVGDHLLAQVMSLLDEADDRDATRRINRTVTAMTEAELLAQETNRHPGTLTIEQYMAIIDGKTACLFATACALGNPQYEDFGLHYGRLFQLRDDQADGETTPYTAELIAREEATIKSLPSVLNI